MPICLLGEELADEWEGLVSELPVTELLGDPRDEAISLDWEFVWCKWRRLG